MKIRVVKRWNGTYLVQSKPFWFWPWWVDEFKATDAEHVVNYSNAVGAKNVVFVWESETK